MIKSINHTKQSGFTLVELMIASTVFSTVLLLLSISLIQVTRLYYKGVTVSKTQQTARNITDTISRSIQFSGGTVTTINSGINGASYFCINNDRYTFIKDRQLVDGTPDTTQNQANHVLIKDSAASCTAVDMSNLSNFNNPVELMSVNMRLVDLQLNNLGSNLYSLTVSLITGENDLLNPAHTSCLVPQAGSQFCAISKLQTTVQKRI